MIVTNPDRNQERVMDLSLATNKEREDQIQPTNTMEIPKEHMFDKAVTPSDVGKLNRLVIPKQHAEKYFPLDSSSNEKGLLLNFEDRNGKSWRFRYSYWNSSQSYVMTKGWSRFVKEKKLDAGDIVSFQRGAGESNRDRLFIDWRRRPNVPHPTSLLHFNGINFLGGFYSFPQSRNFENFHYSYNNQYHHYHLPHEYHGYGSAVGRYYMRSLEQNPVRVAEPVVIHSVPVVTGRAQPAVAAAGKRLRLFGVNMECGSSSNTYSTEDQSTSSGSLPRGVMDSSSCSSLQLRLHSSEESSATQVDDLFSKKGKSSLSFDLDQ